MSRCRRHRWQHTHSISALEIPGCVMSLHWTGLANLAAGGVIATWPDQSGNARDGVQSTNGFRPLYQVNQIGGKPAGVWDGTDDSLDQGGTASVCNGSDKPLTVGVVMKLVALPAPASQAEIWTFGNATNNTPRFQGNLTDQSYRAFRRDDANNPITLVSGTGLTNTSPHIAWWNFTGTALKCHVDGVTVIYAAQDVNTMALDRFSIGCLTSNAVRSGFANVAISEISFWNRSLTNAEMNALQAGWSIDYAISQVAIT